MTAPMPETMSPREKVTDAVREASRSQWNDGVRVGSAKWCNHLTDTILAALASSGDHAELARLAEWRDRLRADPGRAAHFGSPYADKPMHNGRTYWNIDLADDLLALIAEVVALRGANDRLKLAICGGEDVPGAIAAVTVEDCERFCRENHAARGDFIDRATEAERKLAEAMGLHERAAELMRQCTDPERFEGVSTLNVYANMRAWLSDLSKEAERG